MSRRWIPWNRWAAYGELVVEEAVRWAEILTPKRRWGDDAREIFLRWYGAGRWKKKLRRMTPKLAVLAALLLVCAAAIMPFLWMLSTSLKGKSDLNVIPPTLVPDQYQFQNYHDVVTSEHANLLLWTRNTLIITLLSVAGVTLSCAVVAYGFARIRFRGRGVLFGLMLSTVMIPFPVLMTPLFCIFRWLGDHTGMAWLGTPKPLWVPAWFGSAYSIFLLRQFFMTIPEELSEAARIDGCSEWGIFWRIVLPLSKPALAVVALFTFMFAWRDFIGPRVYLQHPSQYTLALGLQTYQSQHGGTPWNLQMAAAVLVIAPLILIFFLTQRTFVEGIATTGVKG